MRLLYVIDQILFRGGTEGHLWELAHGMASRGHEVTVLSLEDGPPYGPAFQQSSQISYQSLKIHRIYDLAGIAGFLRLVSIIRRVRPTVVQTFHTGADLIGPLATLLSCPGAFRISSRRDLGYTKSDRHVRVQSFINRAVHLVLANSQEVARQAILRERIPPARTLVIHNGIDPVPFMALPAARQPDRLVVGTVANLRKVKGVHVLLAAAQLLATSFPSLEIQIAGDGEDRARLEAMATQYALNGRVKFLGSVADVPAFLSSVDIYVQPSLEEGFSNSVLEAMASALPVIATDVGGNKDVVAHDLDGLLIPAGDGPALAAAITELVQDPLRRGTLGQAARRKILASFTISRMLGDYESLYRTRHL